MWWRVSTAFIYEGGVSTPTLRQGLFKKSQDLDPDIQLISLNACGAGHCEQVQYRYNSLCSSAAARTKPETRKLWIPEIHSGHSGYSSVKKIMMSNGARTKDWILSLRFRGTIVRLYPWRQYRPISWWFFQIVLLRPDKEKSDISATWSGQQKTINKGMLPKR